MVDSPNRLKITPTNAGGASGYFFLPESRLKEISAALDRHRINHWPDEFSFSINDRPLTTVITLERKTDINFVQTILDELG